MQVHMPGPKGIVMRCVLHFGQSNWSLCGIHFGFKLCNFTPDLLLRCHADRSFDRTLPLAERLDVEAHVHVLPLLLIRLHYRLLAACLAATTKLRGTTGFQFFHASAISLAVGTFLGGTFAPFP